MSRLIVRADHDGSLEGAAARVQLKTGRIGQPKVDVPQDAEEDQAWRKSRDPSGKSGADTANGVAGSFCLSSMAGLRSQHGRGQVRSGWQAYGADRRRVALSRCTSARGVRGCNSFGIAATVCAPGDLLRVAMSVRAVTNGVSISTRATGSRWHTFKGQERMVCDVEG